MGTRLLKLLKNDWSTHVERNLSLGTSFIVDGFQGDYDVTVYYKGKPIMFEKLHLGKSDMVYVLHVTGNGGKFLDQSAVNVKTLRIILFTTAKQEPLVYYIISTEKTFIFSFLLLTIIAINFQMR